MLLIFISILLPFVSLPLYIFICKRYHKKSFICMRKRTYVFYATCLAFLILVHLSFHFLLCAVLTKLNLHTLLLLYIHRHHHHYISIVILVSMVLRESRSSNFLQQRFVKIFCVGFFLHDKGTLKIFLGNFYRGWWSYKKMFCMNFLRRFICVWLSSSLINLQLESWEKFATMLKFSILNFIFLLLKGLFINVPRIFRLNFDSLLTKLSDSEDFIRLILSESSFKISKTFLLMSLTWYFRHQDLSPWMKSREKFYE